MKLHFFFFKLLLIETILIFHITVLSIITTVSLPKEQALKYHSQATLSKSTSIEVGPRPNGLTLLTLPNGNRPITSDRLCLELSHELKLTRFNLWLHCWVIISRCQCTSPILCSNVKLYQKLHPICNLSMFGHFKWLWISHK